MRNFQKFTSALKATGKAPPPSKNVATAAKVSENDAKKWLICQALWHIYFPAPKHIPCSKSDVSTLNAGQ